MFSKRTLPLIVLILVLISTLACNLTKEAGPTDAPSPTNTPYPGTLPTVAIITPVDGATVQNGQQVDIRSAASDTGGGVTRVELRVDGVPVSQVAPPDGPQIYWTVQQAWIPQEAGTHSIEVIAYRGETASRPATLTLAVQGEIQATMLPTSGECTATINASAGLRVRSGPSTGYDHLYSLPQGTTVSITGRVGDNSWWQVRASDGLVGWVAAEYTDPSGDCRSVPVMQPPPSPTPPPDAAPLSGDTPAANLQVLNIEGPAEVTLSSGSVTATFVITIHNAGTAESGQFNLSFCSHGRVSSESPPQTIAVASLEPGETITAIFSGTYTVARQYAAEAEIDSEKQVAESNEDDNIRTFSIQIKN